MATIKYPGKHDVMLGRGGESNYHSGNIAFRHMVQKYKERFRLGSRTEKNKVIDEVVSEWRDQDPEGRFVAKKTTESGEVVWYDVGNEQAKKRAAKSLAEWTPQTSFGSSSSSSTIRKSGKKSPSPERKRSRSAAGIDSSSSASGLGLQKHKFDGNKRQNVELASRFMMPSFSTADASRHQGNQREGQVPPLQQHQSFSLPLHLFPQPEQEVPSSAATSSSTTARSAAASSGLALLDFALPGPGPAPTSNNLSMPPPAPAALAQDFIVASSTNVGLNQLCSVGTNDSVLPIERIRLQIPTAAELSACAFSDEEKSSRSDSSRGSNHSYSLIPNK